MGGWLGIDLGVTGTRAVCFNRRTQRMESICRRQGVQEIPPAVFVDCQGDFCCGFDAESVRGADELRYETGFIARIGERQSSYVADVNGSMKGYDASQLTRAYLEYLKCLCEKTLKDREISAVLVVPESFDSLKKAELRKTTKEAGFDAVEILPVAEAVISNMRGLLLNSVNRIKTLVSLDFGENESRCSVVSFDLNENTTIIKTGISTEVCGRYVYDRVIRLVEKKISGQIERMSSSEESPSGREILRTIRETQRDCVKAWMAEIAHDDAVAGCTCLRGKCYRWELTKNEVLDEILDKARGLLEKTIEHANMRIDAVILTGATSGLFTKRGSVFGDIVSSECVFVNPEPDAKAKGAIALIRRSVRRANKTSVLELRIGDNSKKFKETDTPVKVNREFCRDWHSEYKRMSINPQFVIRFDAGVWKIYPGGMMSSATYVDGSQLVAPVSLQTGVEIKIFDNSSHEIIKVKLSDGERQDD